MIRTYYELEDDLYIYNRWHLSGLRDDQGIELDAREFRYGNHLPAGPPLKCSLWNEDTIVDVTPPLRISWSREGNPLDFTYTDDDMPVVSSRVAQILANIAGGDIQRFPVKVDRMEEKYEIINIVACIDCLDTELSEIEWWEDGNDIRPDKAGLPHVVDKLVIDPDRVGDHYIFRLSTWIHPIIVSEAVKQALEKARVSGVKFRNVSNANV
jgi:hypothetical protein